MLINTVSTLLFPVKYRSRLGIVSPIRSSDAREVSLMCFKALACAWPRQFRVHAYYTLMTVINGLSYSRIANLIVVVKTTI